MTEKKKNTSITRKTPKARKRQSAAKAVRKERKPIINEDGLVAVKQPLFRCIVADPPWDVNQRGSYGAINHYDLMKLEDIKNMPIADLTEDNAICFLWVVGGVDGHKAGEEVLKAWGFDYKQDFVWVKPRIGIGRLLRHSYEKMMVGVKGKIEADYKGQPDWGFFPLQEHSHKPEEQYAIIERLIKDDRYLELFARKRPSSKKFYIWGNEAEGGSDIVIPGYPVPEYSKKVKLAKPEDLELDTESGDAPADSNDNDERPEESNCEFESDIFTDADMERVNE